MCQLLSYLSLSLNSFSSVGRIQKNHEDHLEMETVREDLKGHLIYLCFMVMKREPRDSKRPVFP